MSMLSTKMLRNAAKSVAASTRTCTSSHQKVVAYRYASSSILLTKPNQALSIGGSCSCSCNPAITIRPRRFHSESQDCYSTSNAGLHVHVDAEPMLALALAPDYEYYDEDSESFESFATISSTSTSTADKRMHLDKQMKMSIHSKYGEGGTNTMSTTSNSNGQPNRKASGGPPSGGGGGSSSGGGGGGGAGKHKCPKCGTSVTFKHADFEDNTFYCASCSGWFLVKNANKGGGDDGSSVSAAAASNGGTGIYGVFNNDNVPSPKISMQHVSYSNEWFQIANKYVCLFQKNSFAHFKLST